ncbi:MAG TPA: T9SS type A sorting domain-containing protein, partial [Flavisolibacter sp.]|nr:T9SS type A sorting domain-containing protein [Flavisolibacter sp.]
SGIILPVTGLAFTVKLSGNTAIINWATLSEINTKNFEIERSTDGSNFKYIATVPAAGWSTVERKYILQDFLQAEGTYYYRLKSIDRDGRSSYSVVKNIVYRYAGDEIIVGPNPFASAINISNLQGVRRLEIIDLSGRIVVSKMLNNQMSIRLEAAHLRAGLYHLKATKTAGDYSIIKLVKL